MRNPYLAEEAVINKITQECSDVKTYNISLLNKKKQKEIIFTAGQFFMIGLPGIGESAISISSSPDIKDSFELTIRLAGKVTKALNKLKKGERVFIRGPFGHGWPEIKKEDDIVLIAGGVGLPAIKPILDDYCHGRISCKNIQLFYGTTNIEKLVCVRYYGLWKKEAHLCMTLDKGDKRWKEHVGVITGIIQKAKISAKAKAFVIGPPIMYKFVIAELKNKGLKDENIYVSLERRMHCGVGVCQHCACGHLYTCKDGPVFQYSQIKDIPFAI
ncbi:MAG: FAD/NAD(P)-binding protein [Patescibacteria group bacterium]|jgi:NAD(P)H-flavin reductase